MCAAARVQDVVEDGADKEDAECVEEADGGGEHYGGDDLKPVAACIVQQAPPTLHCSSLRCG